MKNCYLAIDIGASGGRHMVGYINDGRIEYTEAYRFDNGYIEKNNRKCWDLDGIMENVYEGIRRSNELVNTPSFTERFGSCRIASVGVDTWGVDFVLLDENGNIIGDAVSYRDERTAGMDGEVSKYISPEELYRVTGIQKQPFNTIYQLMAVKIQNPGHMERAKAFLMIPDYINYRLSGVMSNEYTNATTTQLVSPKTCEWDMSLIERLGFNGSMFLKPVMPGTVLGDATSEVKRICGVDFKVIAVATHDTASAVAAVPDTTGNSIYISSGTWSLMGVEAMKADCGAESRLHNFTNEGGVERRYRYLKNIMGLWIIQSVRKEDGRYSFSELCDMAREADIDTVIDCNDADFMAPDSMKAAILRYCEKHGLKAPVTMGEYASVIYRSLALCYKNTVEEIEAVTHRTYDTINIVGGGSKADYLNRLTEQYTGKKVVAGPSEATAMGNIAVQMVSDKIFENITQARSAIR